MPRVLTTALALAGGLAAAPADAAGLDGARLGIGWMLPFAGLLLTIALAPLLAPRLWHRHDGKILLGWGLAATLPLAIAQGAEVTAVELLHVALLDYVPFIVLLTGLFTVTGGIALTGNLRGTPMVNTAVLAVGTVLAGWMGTTGASMLMIRVLLAANRDRRHQAHVFVFFIFLVANVGGALSPLGDPPLFLGFLRGVPFFWPTAHLLGPTLLAAGVLLAAFLALDTILWRREPPVEPLAHRAPIRIHGGVNFAFLTAIFGAVMLSGALDLGVVLAVGGVELRGEALLRDAVIVAIILLSLRLGPHGVRAHNHFAWGPMAEVAKIFAAIFVAIIPPLAMLKAGDRGAFADLLAALTRDGRPADEMYFVVTGLLSSFLDNAPTYLVFFNAAGGDVAQLTGPLASTLVAISLGAVFMGANTYIGNAPNFMVRSIAEAQGVRMPSFFGYMGWAAICLLPVWWIVAVVCL